MSSEAETTSATATVTTPTKVAPTGTPTGTPTKETDEARSHLVQGRRHLLVKDYFSAVTALAKACELLAQQYGDTAAELGDAYLTYGRALLELARSESGVLEMNEDGQAEGEEDGDDDEEEGEEEGDDEDGEEEEKNGEAEVQENGEAKVGEKNGDDKAEEKSDEVEKNGKESKKDEVAVEAKKGEDADEASASNGAADSNGKEANGTEEKDGEEDEDDVNNLQLAWEILELAKGIFVKQLEVEGEAGQKANALKLADIHLKLGEVAVESENYTTAVEDMRACLALQRKHLDEDDRRIAETLFNLGNAFSLANEFDSAIEQYKLAAEQIEKRIVTLEKKKAEPAEPASDDPFYTVQGEIDELKALLPDIKEKVTDMQDFKKEMVRRMMDGLAEASAKQSSTADGAGPSSAPDKPVSSVAHLVKRKPKEETAEKPEEKKRKTEDEETGEASKKVKVDDSESKTSE